MKKILPITIIIFLAVIILQISLPLYLYPLGFLSILYVIWNRSEFAIVNSKIFLLLFCLAFIVITYNVLDIMIDREYYYTIDSSTMSSYYDKYGYRGDKFIMDEICIPNSTKKPFSGFGIFDYGITYQIELAGMERGHNDATKYSQAHCFVRVWNN